MDLDELLTNRFLRVCDELKYKKIIKNDVELSEYLGITPQAISGLKRGKGKPSLQIINSLYEKFNINPAFFFAESTPMFMGEVKHYDADGGEVLVLQEEKIKGYDQEVENLKEHLNEYKLLVSLLKEKINLKDE